MAWAKEEEEEVKVYTYEEQFSCGTECFRFVACFVLGTGVDSSPRDSFSISAPNRCNAVIVDGVGSAMLEKLMRKCWLRRYFENAKYSQIS